MRRFEKHRPYASAKVVEQDTSKSISQFLGFLPLAGAILALLSVVGSFAGMLTMQNYYKELGAGWYVSNLPTSRFIQEGAPVLLFCAMAIFFTHMQVRRGVSTGTIRAFACGIGLFGISLSLLSCIPNTVISPMLRSWSNPHPMLGYSMIGSVLMMISAGIAIGALISKVTSDNFQVLRASGIGFAYIVAFWLATYSVGSNHAKFSRDLNRSPLSKLTWPNSGENWRLVEISGDTALVIRLADKPEDVVFKLLKLTENSEVKYSAGFQFIN